jgi:4-amino-4-deoxy-L-arabinose transferase-like glycosyltransferase
MRKVKMARQALGYALFSAILLSTIVLFYFISPGIFMEFDDPVYAYSTAKIQALQVISWGVIAYGFAFITMPFYILLNHSVLVTKIVCLFSLAITMIMLFLIGKMYGSELAGIVASILYAFNPLTMAYAIRYLPDPFIAMLDSIGIAFAVYGAKNNKYWAFLLSGLFFGSGMFFGNQAAISIIAFLPFVPFLWYSFERKTLSRRKIKVMTKRGSLLKVLSYSILGLLIIGVPYFGLQLMFYHNPFYSANSAASFYESNEPNCFPTYLYYLYILLSLKSGDLSCVYSNSLSGLNPYANLSILPILFLLAAIFLILKEKPKKKSIIMPFIIFFIVFYLYVSFGSESTTHYLPLQDINRVLMPLVLIMTIGSALILDKIKNIQLKTIAAIGIIIIYLAFSYSQYHNIYSIYNSPPNSTDWNITESVIHNFGYLNLSGYILDEDYTYMGSGILCMSFNRPPEFCNVIIYTPVPKINCTQGNIFLVYLGNEQNICPNSTGTYYYNTTYKYNVYIGKKE